MSTFASCITFSSLWWIDSYFPPLAGWERTGATKEENRHDNYSFPIKTKVKNITNDAKEISHNLLMPIQSLSNGCFLRKTLPTIFTAGHDVIWYGISLSWLYLLPVSGPPSAYTLRGEKLRKGEVLVAYKHCSVLTDTRVLLKLFQSGTKIHHHTGCYKES